jgi:hypothetical protein
MRLLLFLYLLLRLLHVSEIMCHLQRAYFILVRYFKVRNGCVIGMYPVLDDIKTSIYKVAKMC